MYVRQLMSAASAAFVYLPDLQSAWSHGHHTRSMMQSLESDIGNGARSSYFRQKSAKESQSSRDVLEPNRSIWRALFVGVHPASASFSLVADRHL
jgi:hypothetical protein